MAVARRACEEFAGLGGQQILLTGGEPFLDPELPQLVDAAARWAPVTILTNAMVIGRGSRRRMLDALDPARVTMQVSLDSGTPELHDRHRGAGAFDRARAGIALLRELGFHVRVAATVEETDAAEVTASTRCSPPTASRPRTGLSAPSREPASLTTASHYRWTPSGPNPP